MQRFDSSFYNSVFGNIEPTTSTIVRNKKMHFKTSGTETGSLLTSVRATPAPTSPIVALK